MAVQNRFLTAYWVEPNASILQHQLFGLAGALEKYKTPMTTASRVVRADIKERFDTGTDAQGKKWAPWSERYEPYALAHTRGPVFGDRANLHLTGTLRREVLRATRYVPTNDSLFIDVSGLPAHWAWNNFGATREVSGGEGRQKISQQRVLDRAKYLLKRDPATKTHKQAIFNAIKSLQSEQAGSGTNVLPARPFLGEEGKPALTAGAQAKVVAIFSRWFTDTVRAIAAPRSRTPGQSAFATAASGRRYYAVRGAGGRFAKR